MLVAGGRLCKKPWPGSSRPRGGSGRRFPLVRRGLPRYRHPGPAPRVGAPGHRFRPVGLRQVVGRAASGRARRWCTGPAGGDAHGPTRGAAVHVATCHADPRGAWFGTSCGGRRPRGGEPVASSIPRTGSEDGFLRSPRGAAAAGPMGSPVPRAAVRRRAGRPLLGADAADRLGFPADLRVRAVRGPLRLLAAVVVRGGWPRLLWGRPTCCRPTVRRQARVAAASLVPSPLCWSGLLGIRGLRRAGRRRGLCRS